MLSSMHSKHLASAKDQEAAKAKKKRRANWGTISEKDQDSVSQSSEEEEEEDLSEFDSDQDDFQVQRKRRAGRQARAREREAAACQGIVVLGKSGSGKSAAIAACCHELNLQVIEINPSDRRSGTVILRSSLRLLLLILVCSL